MSVYSAAPLQQRLVTHFSSVGTLQPSGCNGRPMSSPGLLSSGPYAGLHPTLYLLTEKYFRDRSVHPCPTGPGRPGGCLNISGSRPCPPPLPSLLHGHLFWVAYSLTGQFAVMLNVPWVNLRHRRGPRAKVTALARCGTLQKIVAIFVSILTQHSSY